jgi:Tol biopolymer transport system component
MASGSQKMLEVTDDLISESEVRMSLERILGSESFRNSGRMCRFLSFVVDRGLAADTASLKETVVGITVYDRPATYDPKLDPVVRNEARRLRVKLDEYYCGPGLCDSIRIVLPKGGYVPLFQQQEPKFSSSGQTTPLQQEQSAQQVPRPRIETAPSSNRGSRFLWIILAAVLLTVLLLAAGLTHILLQRKLLSQEGFDGQGAGHIVPLTSMSGRTDYPAISPDEREIAFSREDEDGYFHIYVMQPGGSPIALTEGHVLDLGASWSPDGRTLTFQRVGLTSTDVVTVPFPGGGIRRVRSIPHPPFESLRGFDVRSCTRSAWSRDGESLILSLPNTAQSGAHLVLHHLKSGHEAAITWPGPSMRDTDPAVSPNGDWIAFLRSTSFGSSDVYLASTRGERRLTALHADMQGLAWYPDGEHLLVSSDHSGAQLLWRVNLRGEPMQLLPTSGEAAISPAISINGKLVAYVDQQMQTDLIKVPLGLRGQADATVLARSSRQSNSAQFSPDGRRIAFVSNRSGGWQLWLTDAAGANSQQLTQFNSSVVGSPRWSPDGLRIAFDARPDGHSEVFLIDADGNNLRRIDSNHFEEKQPNWSPDGAFLYFNSDRSGSMAVWAIRLADGTTSPVTKAAGSDPQSRPGSGDLFLASGSGQIMRYPGQLKVTSSSITEIQPVDLDFTPATRAWFVSTVGIYYITPGLRSIALYNPQRRTSVLVAHIVDPLSLGTPSLSISPDGRFALLSRESLIAKDTMLITK